MNYRYDIAFLNIKMELESIISRLHYIMGLDPRFLDFYRLLLSLWRLIYMDTSKEILYQPKYSQISKYYVFLMKTKRLALVSQIPLQIITYCGYCQKSALRLKFFTALMKMIFQSRWSL